MFVRNFFSSPTNTSKYHWQKPYFVQLERDIWVSLILSMKTNTYYVVTQAGCLKFRFSQWRHLYMCGYRHDLNNNLDFKLKSRSWTVPISSIRGLIWNGSISTNLGFNTWLWPIITSGFVYLTPFWSLSTMKENGVSPPVTSLADSLYHQTYLREQLLQISR